MTAPIDAAADNRILRNRMGVLFIKPEFRSAAWRLIMGEKALVFAKEHLSADATPRVRHWVDDPEIHVEYEVDGWDALLKMPAVVRDEARPALRDVYLRFEPVVGDDFLELLRAMKAKFAPTFGEWRALIIDRLEAEGVSPDDLRGMFEQDDISVVTLTEIRAATPAGA